MPKSNINNKVKISLIGGGTGNFTLLTSIKKYFYNPSVIVNMSDNGGSTGLLRDELGVLPPGDVRQCLVALSDNPEVRNLFNYRFNSGRFKNQSLGNIILSGLELQYDSFEKAIEIASTILNIKGRVVPITLDKQHLVMEDQGKIIKGEYKISTRIISSPNAKLNLKPDARINKTASKILMGSDIILISPGNLYGSLLPIFIVNGFLETILRTKAKVIYVANLVNKPGQTDNWHVVDYVKKIEKYIGKDRIDIVLYNNEPIPSSLLQKYASKGEYPVDVSPQRFEEIKAKCYGRPIVAKNIIKQDPNDKKIQRTLIRHDSEKVSQFILGLI